MSTDEQYTVDSRETIGDVLEHPLLGLEGRRTAVAIAYLLGLLGLFVVSYAGPAVTIGGVALETRFPQFDTISAILIAVVAATIAILPFVYAVWNGGPALSFGLPLVPVLLGDIAGGQYVLTLDMALALTVGAVASALALFATDVRRTGSLRPWNTAIDANHLLFATMLAVVAAVGVGRFLAGAPPRSLEWYAPFGVLWLVPLGIVGSYWLATVRTSVTTGAEHERAEP